MSVNRHNTFLLNLNTELMWTLRDPSQSLMSNTCQISSVTGTINFINMHLQPGLMLRVYDSAPTVSTSLRVSSGINNKSPATLSVTEFICMYAFWNCPVS